MKAARYAVKTIKVSLRVAEPCTGHANNPADAVAILRPIFDALDADQEHAVLLALSNQNQVTGYKTISSGASNASLIDPRIVFRAALLLGASGVILAHSHPGGSTEPSRDDVAITRRLKAAGEALELPLRDHLILTPTGAYCSMAERGML